MIRQTPFARDPEWKRLQELLRQLAQEELMQRFRHVEIGFKADGSLVTEADRAMQRAVQQRLAELWPTYAFLGEESSSASQQQALGEAGGCWILDPLDGTTNYTHGFEIFTSSLALTLAGKVVLGMVYDPVRDELFAARRGMGAELDGRSLAIGTAPGTLRAALALVDFKRLPRALATVLATEPPFASQRNIGSVALDWCWMAAGRADLYLHGGQKLWDYAAGQLIFSEAGGASCTLQGEPVPGHSMEPRSAVAARSESLLETWKGYLDSIMAQQIG